MNPRHSIFAALFPVILLSCASVTMPSPKGAYPVGTTFIDLTDDSRSEQYAKDPNQKRRVALQVWYPAADAGAGKKDLYIDSGLRKAMVSFMGMPDFVIGKERFSNSYIDAPVAGQASNFPVVVFNHGYGSYAKQNYSQMESLASQGFIVLSLSHPYTSIITEFADHSNLERASNTYWENQDTLQRQIDQIGGWYQSFLGRMRAETTIEGMKAKLAELSQSQLYSLLGGDFETWVLDTISAINSLGAINDRPGVLRGKIDLDSVGIYGHSFGGSVSAEVALRLPQKVKALINLDGPCLIYQYPKTAALAMPSLFVYSTKLKIGNAVCDQTGLNQAYVLGAKRDSYSVSLTGAAHHNFSDMTYIDFLRNTSMLGPIDNAKAGHITDDLVAAFFAKYLRNVGDKFEALSQYPELSITKAAPAPRG